MSTTSAPRPRHRRTAVLAAVCAASFALTGCGLRLETPPPTEPSPDATEQVRADTVDDALDLAQIAAAMSSGADAEVLAALTLVQNSGATHAEQLGGVYDSGLPQPTDSPTTAAPAAADTTDDLLALLGSTSADARADALTATDPQTARLLASIAASRAQQATQLARALGVDAPSFESAAAETTETEAAGSADGSGSGDGSATAAPTDTGSTLNATTLAALIAAEDQAGFGYEVAAARLSDDARTAALNAARTHRARAEEWAQSAGVSGTGQDPRRVSYDLGPTPGDAEAVRTFCAGLERQLTDVYADAILDSDAATADDPGTERAVLVDRLRTAALDLMRWGGTATALPGMDMLVEPEPTATP